MRNNESESICDSNQLVRFPGEKDSLIPIFETSQKTCRGRGGCHQCGSRSAMLILFPKRESGISDEPNLSKIVKEIFRKMCIIHIISGMDKSCGVRETERKSYTTKKEREEKVMITKYGLMGTKVKFERVSNETFYTLGRCCTAPFSPPVSNYPHSPPQPIHNTKKKGPQYLQRTVSEEIFKAKDLGPPRGVHVQSRSS